MSHLSPQNPNSDPYTQDTGYPRNTPTSVSYSHYNPPVGQTSAIDFGSIDPALMEVQRKRSATRKTLVTGGIIGLITMIIQMIFTTTSLVLLIIHGEYDLPFGLSALFAVLITPRITGIARVVAFILTLIACIRVHPRAPQGQPDRWVEAKMPTPVLLATSIVVGPSAFIACAV